MIELKQQTCKTYFSNFPISNFRDLGTVSTNAYGTELGIYFLVTQSIECTCGESFVRFFFRSGHKNGNDEDM